MHNNNDHPWVTSDTGCGFNLYGSSAEWSWDGHQVRPLYDHEYLPPFAFHDNLGYAVKAALQPTESYELSPHDIFHWNFRHRRYLHL